MSSCFHPPENYDMKDTKFHRFWRYLIPLSKNLKKEMMLMKQFYHQHMQRMKTEYLIDLTIRDQRMNFLEEDLLLSRKISEDYYDKYCQEKKLREAFQNKTSSELVESAVVRDLSIQNSDLNMMVSRYRKVAEQNRDRLLEMKREKEARENGSA